MTLKNGPDVRDSAIALAIEMETRGHFMTHVAGALKVTRAATLTPADCAAIRADRTHLIAICDYIADRRCDAHQA